MMTEGYMTGDQVIAEARKGNVDKKLAYHFIARRIFDRAEMDLVPYDKLSDLIDAGIEYYMPDDFEATCTAVYIIGIECGFFRYAMTGYGLKLSEEEGKKLLQSAWFCNTNDGRCRGQGLIIDN